MTARSFVLSADVALLPGEVSWRLAQVLRQWESVQRAAGRPVAPILAAVIDDLEYVGGQWFAARQMSASAPEAGKVGSSGAQWVSVRAAASLLGVSEPTVRRRLGLGSLTGNKNGRDWAVDIGSIARKGQK